MSFYVWKTLGLAGILASGPVFAQAAPSTTAPTTPPSQQSKPAAITKKNHQSIITDPTTSAVVVKISGALKSKMMSCPSKLQVSKSGVCLYATASLDQARKTIQTTLAGQAIGKWKREATSSSLLISNNATKSPKITSFILLHRISNTETLVVVDALAKPVPIGASKPQMPKGAVKGEPYLLDSDLIGVLKVGKLAKGQYKMSIPGQEDVVVMAGSTTAQRKSGQVQLNIAPVTDGKNLLFPLSGLPPLGCKVSKAKKGVTVTCGRQSVDVLPIVF